MYGDELLDLARRALVEVERDLHATTARRPQLSVEFDEEHGLLFRFPNGRASLDIHELAEPEALAEMAMEVQDDLSHNEWCWPVCTSHDRGLHAEVLDGEAVWRCTGGHVVAAIGGLTPGAHVDYDDRVGGELGWPHDRPWDEPILFTDQP